MIGLLLVLLLFGLIAGALARLLLPGRDPMGIPMTILLGLAGSFLGGLIGSVLFGNTHHAFRPAGLLGSVLGALFLLLLYRSMSRGRRERRESARQL
ncbi:MAG TPA: GlsB/YeaQ/YmgE family stress response membrane protein [Acidimicrobiia bacterium]|nr:GlsB/YeaQ/YmgE family stress response membrane protein [Acidimicrobiia bacterium]